MDNHHILLLLLLLLSETMGAIPEKYLWMNGFLDILCKGIKEALKARQDPSPRGEEEEKVEI
jgi:hypothetical protein